MSGTIRQLRHHVPFAGPATREPLVGDEPCVRVSLGFTPRWFHSRLGMDLGERWHLDPEYRYETLVQMKEHLHETFPMVPEFVPEYDARGVERNCATIDGVYGIMPIPLLYGLTPVYRMDNWPEVKSDGHLGKGDIDVLSPPDPGNASHMRQLLGQMEWIEKKAGRIHGYVNYQSVLNTALKVRGNEIFIDMMDDPGWTKRFFRHIMENMAAVATLVQERQARSGFTSGILTVSNCVMNMISPAQYEEFVLPLDLELSTRFPAFGVHTCNWDATPYLDKLRKIGKMGYLDTGTMADLGRIRRMFPDTRRCVLYGPVELEQKSESELVEDITRIAREYGPCDIALADIENTTPDDRVRCFLDAAAEVSRRIPNGPVGGSP